MNRGGEGGKEEVYESSHMCRSPPAGGFAERDQGYTTMHTWLCCLGQKVTFIIAAKHQILIMIHPSMTVMLSVKCPKFQMHWTEIQILYEP
uniref:Uncharacterized protein n=1 Tax=Oryza nivara TaxID=4536 RepID=A0A0E0HZI5_ORYNI